jgi:hypothetical protein
MGYLDNTTVTIDAILTKKGRELLAKGRSQFNITKFALADDEVDYDLWNPSHPRGIDYFGTVIENMPITEAVPDETQSLKYKLITMDRGQISIPYLRIDNLGTDGGFTIDNLANVTQAIAPKTYQVNNTGPQETQLNTSYTFTLLDNTYITIDNVTGTGTGTGQSITTEASSITLRPRVLSITSDKKTKLIITGTGTGARLVLPITVKYIAPTTV